MMKNINFVFVLITMLFISNCTSDKPLVDPNNENSGSESINTTISLEFNANYDLIWSDSKVKDRNFHLLTIIEQIQTISKVIESDVVFSNYLKTSQARLRAVSEASNPTAQSYANALKFSENEITALSENFKELVKKSRVLHNMVKEHMGPSGAFQQFSEVTNSYRVIQLAFVEAAHGINNIIDVYAAGQDPKYPEIDKVSFDVNSAAYLSKLKTEVDALNQANHKLFFQPFLKFALRVLALNNRDEAGRYYPLEDGENKATIEYIKTINWNEYEYALALALGDGPNEPNDLPNISIGGMRNADQAVELYQQGRVPLIMLSGGHVKPFQVEYSEGIEMKKYIIDKYSILENRILVETQARHTTTNMRNTGRLIFRYGIPSNKKSVVTSSESHINTIESSNFNVRSINEMNHIPAEIYNRISNIYLEFTSKIEVLHLDSSDPLDP
ncbi:YdcF family protein [Polaribacter filamentus]|nr:YdcF family protein [Polaribacter filamentus]